METEKKAAPHKFDIFDVIFTIVGLVAIPVMIVGIPHLAVKAWPFVRDFLSSIPIPAVIVILP